MSKPFRIEPKRDFGPNAGFYRNGKFTRVGFIVTNNYCNIMPGGTFFSSVAEALKGVEIYLAIGGHPKHGLTARQSQEWWKRFYEKE